MTTPIPYLLEHPKVMVNDTIALECMASEIHTNVSQDSNTTETFCGTYTSYKPEVWDLTLTAYQSFGADGLEAQLRPLVGTLCDLAVWPKDATASVDNPVWEAQGILQSFPFIDGAVGETSEFDLVFAVQGEPNIGITEPAGASATSAATSSGSGE